MPEKTLLTKQNVNLHLLSPLHIGTGQEIDPFSYVIFGDKLYFIDLVRWMDSFPDKALLSKMVDGDNYAALRTFIAKNIAIENFSLTAVAIDCPLLLTTYRNAIDRQDARNQVLIRPTIRNEINCLPYIPGSSVKGAIRTALANRFVRKAGVTPEDARRNRGPDYNEKIFGRIKDDPMRFLKIADTPVAAESSVIIEAEELSCDEMKTPTPKGFFETVKGCSQTKMPVVLPLSLSLTPFTLHGEKVDAPYLLESLNLFYLPKFRDEFKKFYSNRDAEKIRKAMSPILERLDSLKTNEALLRIGHFSHVECVTLDDVRRPITRKDKSGRPLPWGTTRTLANGLHPFGWCLLEMTDMNAQAVKETAVPTGKKVFIREGKPAKEAKVNLSKLGEKFRVK